MNAFGATFEERLLAPGEDTTGYQSVSRFLNDEVLSVLANAPPNPQPVPLPAMGAPFALVVMAGLGWARRRRRAG
jgi:MYXO-CTERM domain-containing protein